MPAPISVSEYKLYPLVKVPTGYTDGQVTTQINNAWRTIVGKCHQPLDSTTNTDVYIYPSKYVNQTGSGKVKIALKNTPVISLTSVKWSTNIKSNGWTTLTEVDLVENSVICHNAPFARVDYGYFQCVYVSGYVVIPDDLKEACALLTAHLLSGGVFPTDGGTGEGSVLALWVPKDVTETIKRYTRVF